MNDYLDKYYDLSRLPESSRKRLALIDMRDFAAPLVDEIERLQARVAKLEGYLDQLLNQCAGDHMTACEKTMGDSHPCTCGATEIRKHYRRLRHDA